MINRYESTLIAHGIINAILRKKAEQAPKFNGVRRLYLKLDNGKKIPLRWAFVELFRMKEIVPSLHVHAYGARDFFEKMGFKVGYI